MRNAVFGKTMENVRKHRNIKLVTTERRRNYLVPEPNRHNNPVYQGLSISDLSKTVMYEFWYGFGKPKYGENTKLCYIDKDSFIVYVKADDIYKDIAVHVETRFDTLNFALNKKVIGLLKDELGGKIMKKLLDSEQKHTAV